jgi:hypothetical protein
MSFKIHPDLRLEAGVALFFGWVFLASSIFLIFWGLILVGVLVGLIHWFNSDPFQASIVGWLVPTLCFLSGAVLFYAGRHLVKVHRGWLRRVNWLLGNGQPRKMILTFPQRPGTSSRVAELREAGKQETSGPSETVEVRSPQWKIKDFGATLAEVFRELEPDGIMVMVTSYGIIWGFRRSVGFADSTP